MSNWQRLSTVSLLAGYLRDELERGRWSGRMPGVIRLARELGVARNSVVGALRELERDGLLLPQGHGRGRLIQAAGGVRQTAGLRVKILLYEESDVYNEHIVRLGHHLELRGHEVAHAAKTQRDLHFDVKLVARMVERDDGDAWVILAGALPILKWFAARPVPAFALFGRQSQLPIARIATLKPPAVAEAVRRLVALGHRRIVMLARNERRKPTIGTIERRFLEELERLGIITGAYNLPDWEDNAQGFQNCLDSLFLHSPPTALFLNEPALFFAAQQYLLRKGSVIPRDVSLIVLEGHPAFEWFLPQVSHLHIDTRRCVPRVVQWVENVAKGKEDRRETLLRAEFVDGGTIGPAPGKPVKVSL